LPVVDPPCISFGTIDLDPDGPADIVARILDVLEDHAAYKPVIFEYQVDTDPWTLVVIETA
jgi:hypothetical protein